ncbi:heterokaryon incompatibility protein-domain-containing protein, partial [Fusarium oxysporum f. sp. albedinis]
LVEARNWQQECQLTHEKCNQSARPIAEPKRLIYVGGSSDSTALIESLRESVGHYAALSYCWGDMSQNYYRTTRETLASRLQGFNINDLPKTLQDAVKVTRALGLEYIWVDVLCIVQDDSEDCNEQMSHVGHIYQNAAVTIHNPSFGITKKASPKLTNFTYTNIGQNK